MFYLLECIVCSWIYGSIWVIPPLFGWNRFIFEGFGTTCAFDYISKRIWDRLYVLILVTGGFLIPLLLILISYAFILIRLSKRRRLMFQKNNDQSPHTPSRQLNFSYSHSTQILNSQESQRKTAITSLIDDTQIARNVHSTVARATHTALLLCAVFCAAWGPYALMAILSQFGFDYLINVYITAILGLFTKTAACINPLVYALSSSEFRRYLCFQPQLSHHHVSVSIHR
jgi:r-opsin